MVVSAKVKYALVVLVLGISTQTAAENNAGLKFSEFEQHIWHIVQNSSAENPLTLLRALGTDVTEPADQALLLMHQCRLAVRQSQQPQPALLQQLSELNQPDAERRVGAAALTKCQQYHAMLDAGSNQILQLENTAYYGLNASDGPLMQMWLSFDFSNAAMDAGFIDEALKAIEHSLAIARQNGLSEWVSESLGLLALLQSDLGQYQQALATVAQGLSQAKDPLNRETLHLRQAFVLKQAKHYDEALAAYQQLLYQAGPDNEQVYITAALNISAIYQATRRHAENLQLTAQLLQRLDKTQDPYSFAQAATLRAIALLSNDQFQAAAPLFTEAQQWFEQNEWLVYLVPTLEQWADLLAQKGYFAEAYRASQQSKQLRDQLNEQRRLRDATLQNAQLEVARQQQALLESRQAHQQVTAELARKEFEQRSFQLILVSLLLLALTILWAYVRLRQANQALAAKNEELDYESTHDPLTKVFNRRYFNQFIQQKLAQGGEALLLLIDIDHFKKVNDTYGHHAGDQVLEIVSKRLAGRLRDNDRIIRWGGEEFLIFIEKPSDSTNAAALVQRLLSEVASTPVQLAHTQLTVTISAGFAMITLSDLQALESTLNQIDESLYRAKTQGRNQAVGSLPQPAQELLTIQPAL